MKRILDRKVYDTETAKLIAKANHLYPGDFHYWSAALYRTDKGSYFIAGEGGPMSDYAERLGDGSFGGSSRLWPVTPEEAYEWCEKNERTEAIEAHFSDTLEDA